MKKFSLWQQFHWRIFLLRILASALALSLTVVVLPDIYFINPSIGSVLLITLVLGLLNALVRPVLQLLTIRLLFVSYGLILVVTNTLILYLLALLVPSRFSVVSLLWALVAGLLVGILSNFVENLFGVTPPILPDEAKALRKHIEEQDTTLLEAWLQNRRAARKQSQAAEQAGLLPEPDQPAEPGKADEAVESPADEPAPVSGGER
jgi:putative membrane protein